MSLRIHRHIDPVANNKRNLAERLLPDIVERGVAVRDHSAEVLRRVPCGAVAGVGEDEAEAAARAGGTDSREGGGEEHGQLGEGAVAPGVDGYVVVGLGVGAEVIEAGEVSGWVRVGGLAGREGLGKGEYGGGEIPVEATLSVE